VVTLEEEDREPLARTEALRVAPPAARVQAHAVEGLV
jgi:DUF971 family protein